MPVIPAAEVPAEHAHARIGPEVLPELLFARVHVLLADVPAITGWGLAELRERWFDQR